MEEPREERKVATVLFADLVGSTQLAGGQDPERTRALLNRFYDAMAAEISSAGGTVEKFVGDAVMAAFGAPLSQEDHAERALHAALSMRLRLDELFGDALSLRIGVNTGEVVVGQAREGSSFVSGDAVNVAARLEQAAGPGEILVGERTASAVRGAFELEEPTRVEAKGKEGGVACRRLVRALSLMRPRGVGGLREAFVGREHEVDVLRASYARARATDEPQLVTILGEAGIGKTTLVRELWGWLGSQLPEPLRRTGRCLSYGQGITYVPVGEIVREHLGLVEGGPADVIRRRLGRHEMLGLALGLEAPEDLHPLAARDRLRQAWVSFLEELVSERPAVVLVEDLHWAEEPLLDLLEAAFHDVRGPLLILATARPEFLQARPGWGVRGGRSQTLWLEALSTTDSERMVEQLVPATLPESIREVVIARAEGNPFFVEEVVRTLIDQGVLRRNGGWTVGEVPPDLAVPDTVQAVLAARIDLLAPAEKAALQAAAVIGRTFWSGPVYQLVGALEPDLRLLEERDFIRHRPSSSISGEREFAIKHALTREVAYESLPKAKRAHLHAQFAKWLERTGDGRRDEQAAMLAHHYAAAADPAEADLAWTGAEAELAPVRERAVFWLRRAAELAVGRYEIEDAIALLERAAALEPDRSAQVEIWREIGHANALYYNAGGFSAAMKHAIELAGDEPDATELYSELAFQAVIRLGMWGVPPDVRLVEGWTAQALERAPAASTARAKALIARCYSDYDKSSELVAEACEVAERLGETSLRSYAYDVRAVMAFAAGEHDESSHWCDRRLALVDEITDPDHKADIYANAIAPAVARGRFDDAQRYALLHGDVTSGLSPHHRLHGVGALLELRELRGDWDGAVELERPIEDAVADNAATPCVRNPRSLLVCAIAHAYRGEESDTRRLEERAQEHSMTGYGTVLDTPRIQLALHRGDLDAVASLLGEPAVRRSNWFYLSSMATHLDALAALRDRERVELEANSVLRPNTYLEPFALRALGIVREDKTLIERAAATFGALGLAWHAATTRALL